MHLRRNIILLFSANTVSNFASGITVLAIPWYLVNLPESENGNEKTFLMMAIVTGITMVWGMFAGSLIDRYNRKRIFQVLQAVDCLVIAGAGAFAGLTGEMPFWTIALVEGITICSWTLFYPNLYAFCQELVRPEKYKQINSAIELQGQATTFLGMLVGPMLMTGRMAFDWGFWAVDLQFHRWELWELFLLDGGTYALSVTIISLIKYVPGEYISKSVGSVFARIRSGFQYLVRDRAFIIFGIASYNIFFVILVFVQAALAIYVQGYMGFDYESGAPIIGGFEIMYALGAISAGFMGVVLARWMARSNVIKQIIFLLFLSAALFTLLSLFNLVAVLYLSGFLVGIANAGTRILRITYIARVVPNHMIGRVNTLFTMVNAFFRLSLFSLFLIPFFSAPGNGPHIIYATAIMAAVCLVSGVLLVIYFASFNQKAAYG